MYYCYLQSYIFKFIENIIAVLYDDRILYFKLKKKKL